MLTLEQVVIAEAQRSFTYFHLYGYPTDLVIANRVLPDEVGEYFRGWYEAQQRYGPLVDNTFHPIPVRKAPFFDREMVGIDLLRQLAACPLRRGRPGELLLPRPPVRGHARQRRPSCCRSTSRSPRSARSTSRATPTS